MARSGLKIRIGRKTNAVGFDVESLNDKSAIRERNRKSVLRMIVSTICLITGALMFYVALHYIPAFAQPRKILKLASGDAAALQAENFDRKSNLNKYLSPFTRLFYLDRAYMKAGQSIEIEYDLPPGAYANLDITQCRRAWVIEVFRCDVVGRFSSRTKRQIGVESFSLEDPGFYYFKHELVDLPEGEPYRIVWERGK